MRDLIKVDGVVVRAFSHLQEPNRGSGTSGGGSDSRVLAPG